MDITKETQKSQPLPSFSNYQYITNHVSVIPSPTFWIIFKQTSDSQDFMCTYTNITTLKAKSFNYSICYCHTLNLTIIS